MPPLSAEVHTGLKRAKSAHVCCTCRHRCQNVNESGVKVKCQSFFTVFFGPPHWRVPKRFNPAGVSLCERHAKIAFPDVAPKKRRMAVKPRNTGKQPALAKRASAAPREAEASVAFDSAGADDSDESDEGDAESDGAAAREVLDGEHVVEWDEVDDSVAFEHTMKKAKKTHDRKKKLMKKFTGDASGMTGVSDGDWGMVAC
jgi:hypothetical protein